MKRLASVLLLVGLLATAPAAEASAETPAPGEGHQVAAAPREDARRLAYEPEGARAPRAHPADEEPSPAKGEAAVRSDDGSTEAKASPPPATGKREDHGGDDR